MKKAKAIRYFMLFLPLIIAGIIVGKMSWFDANKIALPSGELINPEELRSPEVLDVLAEHANKFLPKKIDSATELRSVEGREGELVYHYVKNASSNQFDSKKFTEKLRPQVITSACRNPRLRIFLAEGVSVRYSFRGSDNQLIGDILVTPSKCGYETL